MILQQQSANYRCLQQMWHCWKNLLNPLISIENKYLETEAIKNYMKGGQSWVIGKAYLQFSICVDVTNIIWDPKSRGPSSVLFNPKLWKWIIKKSQLLDTTLHESCNACNDVLVLIMFSLGLYYYHTTLFLISFVSQSENLQVVPLFIVQISTPETKT